MLIAETQGMLKAGEFEKLFTLLVPPEQLSKIQESPGGLEKAINQFKERKAGQLT